MSRRAARRARPTPVGRADVRHGRGRGRHRARNDFGRRRRVLIGVSAALLLAVFAVAWVGLRGLAARDELQSAIPLAREMKLALVEGDFEGAQRTLDTAAERSQRAVELTSDPVWRLFELVPVLGSNLTAVRELAGITDDMLDDVVGPALDAVGSLDPASLAPKDGAIDLAPIIEGVAVFTDAKATFDEIRQRTAAVEVGSAVGAVVDAKQRLSSLVESVAPEMETAGSIVPLVPDLLGASGPRNYVVTFMNSAEARALGGTALSFVPIAVDGGRITIGDPVQAGFGNFDRYDPGELRPVPEGFDDLFQYGSYGTFIPNATTRPDFTDAGPLISAMWSDNIGGEVDAVFALDLTALSYAMRGLEPTVLSNGAELSSDTIVSLLLNQIYLLFPEDNRTQDAFYAEVVSSVAGRLIGGQFEPESLIEGLVQASTERRLLAWSDREEEQAAFVALSLDGTLPVDDPAAPRLGVYFHDNVGSKMNYYLASAVQYGRVSCSDGVQTVQLTITLRNDIPAADPLSLGPSILGNWRKEGLDPGVQRLFVLVYAPPGASIANTAQDGVAVPTSGTHDGELVATRFTIEVAPGQTTTLSAAVTLPLPADGAPPTIETTPMVKPTSISPAADACA